MDPVTSLLLSQAKINCSTLFASVRIGGPLAEHSVRHLELLSV